MICRGVLHTQIIALHFIIAPAEKFEKEAAEMNKRSFKYAWVRAAACLLS